MIASYNHQVIQLEYFFYFFHSCQVSHAAFVTFVNVFVPHMEFIFYCDVTMDLSDELFSLLTFRLSTHDIVAPLHFPHLLLYSTHACVCG